jgi:toxin ParE1/3/4
VSLQLTPKAEADLESISDYIVDDDPKRARAFVAELREQCEEIARDPQICGARPELGDGLRSCVRGRYMIFVRTNGPDVLIVRVLRD